MPKIQFFEIFWNIGNKPKVKVNGLFTFAEAEDYVWKMNQKYPERHYWFQEEENAAN